ncbi:MAG TPA: zinc ABC transporter substrate-binding protein [Steroidobacteraceae bacterium]|nr:zinc ABC transporter substrate-binding protein [Steroidobacteraceae bacterium]
MLRVPLTALLALAPLACAPAAALAQTAPPAPAAVERPLRIVAAENFYGDIAAQLAGPNAQVMSVLRNAAGDPHLFEPDISTARAVAGADLVIYNGSGYDVWMERLLAATRAPHRRVVIASSALPRAAAGRNPHLWYDPALVASAARAIAAQLAELDPARRAQYSERLARFLASLRPIEAQIANLRSRFAGAIVAATEPIAQYLTDAIGLTMSNARFQLAVMNGTEPSARDTADFERSLEEHRVRVLIYNSQVSSSAVDRLLAIAKRSQVPVVGMTETQPPGVDYQQWMLGEIDALGRALLQTVPRAH